MVPKKTWQLIEQVVTCCDVSARSQRMYLPVLSSAVCARSGQMHFSEVSGKQIVEPLSLPVCSGADLPGLEMILVYSKHVGHMCRGAMRTMMITGDYHHTAIAVAKSAGMIPQGGKLVIIQAASEAAPAAAEPSRAATASVHQSAEKVQRQSRQRHLHWQLHEQDPQQQGPVSAPKQGNSNLGDCSTAEARVHSCAEQTTSGPSLDASPSAVQTAWAVQSKGQGARACAVQNLGADASMGLQRKSSLRTQSNVFPERHLVGPHQQRGAVERQQHQQQQGIEAPAQYLPSIDGKQTEQEMQSPQPGLAQQGRLQLPHDHDTYKMVRDGASSSCASQGDPAQHQLSQHPLGSDPLEDLCAGLWLTSEGYSPQDEPRSALQALQSVAQGQAQCCVTGRAFDHMLQHPEPAAMFETVLQNAVMFARMRSHQKGQVMELLSSRGLHQIVAGQKRHIPVSCVSRHVCCVHSTWLWVAANDCCHLAALIWRPVHFTDGQHDNTRSL